MYTLENDKVRFLVDKMGNLLELTNKNTSTNYAGGGSLWRLIYQDGISLEEELDNSEIVPEIRQGATSLQMIYKEAENADLAFNMNVTISLDDDNLTFDLDLENMDKKCVIRECQFPMISACNVKEDHQLYRSTLAGQRYENISKIIGQQHTKYVAQDNKEIQMSSLYPGLTAMNFFIMASDKEGLYFGSHDDSFQITNHYFSKSKDDVNAAIIKYPFLATGEKTSIKNNVLSPYSGSWHVASGKYRKWADSWFKPGEIPQSIKDMKAWHRIIMRHQYGKTFFRYDQLEEILSDGKTAGIDTLFMFGWHNGGHDSEYPDYSCDETQGGFEGLKKNIKKFQDGGGKVILYFNGRLIDAGSEFYRSGAGKKACIKRPNGTEHAEFYPFGGDGTALRDFGNKSFVTACPSSREWQKVLRGHIDKAVALGCDGVFFDQLGLNPTMCFDPEHGHKVPFTDIMKVNADNLKALREYTKAQKPDMSFGIEWVSDVTAQHVDFVHTLRQGTDAINDWEGKGEKPKSIYFPELFRYSFPEVVLSDREIRDDTDVDRRVNFALMKGLRSDVEIYRCRATIAETPHYQAYLKKANLLREKYRDIILNGCYTDTDHFELDNPEFFATSFTSGDKLAVMVSQSHLENAKGVLKVNGYEYVEHDGLNNYSVESYGDKINLSIDRHGLALIVFSK